MNTSAVRYPLQERERLANARVIKFFESLTEKELDRFDDNKFVSDELLKLTEYNKDDVTKEINLIIPVAPLASLIYQYSRDPVGVKEIVPVYNGRYWATITITFSKVASAEFSSKDKSKENKAICAFISERLRKNRRDGWNLQPLMIVSRNDGPWI